ESGSSSFVLDFEHPDTTHFVSQPPPTRTPGTSKTTYNIAVTIGPGFSFERFMESFIQINNNTGSSEWIRIYDVYFEINGTVKTGVQTKSIYGLYDSKYIDLSQSIPVGLFTSNFHKLKTQRKLLSFSQKDVRWD